MAGVFRFDDKAKGSAPRPFVNAVERDHLVNVVIDDAVMPCAMTMFRGKFFYGYLAIGRFHRLRA